LLGSLPTQARASLAANLKLVELQRDEVIYESGHPLQYVLFPTTAIVSVSYVLANGQSSEIGIVGNDGVVGIALFMGGNTMPNRAVVRSAGEGFQLDARSLREEFARGGLFHDLLLRYTQALMTQMLQTSVCNSHHSIDQRLCRWLLLTLDRSHSATIATTQELISRMLGVRREGITEAMGKLQTSGLVESRRGTLEIVDRSGLEARVCECYGVVRDETDRLFPKD
jgi:CRP-like cAMP-binding protein